MSQRDGPDQPQPSQPGQPGQPDRPSHPDSEALLRRVVEVVSNAKSMPLSASVLISKEEVLELLDESLERLPEDLKRARWLLRERDEVLDKARRDGEEIVESARVRAERMVQRTEIVREAQHAANRIVDDARADARRLRHEAEDFCDQRLANFEIVLERLSRTVHGGREKLRGSPPSEDGAGPGSPEGAGLSESAVEDAFFDQDR